MDSQNQLDEFLNKHKLSLAIGFVGLVLLVGGVLSSGLLTKTFIKSTKTPIAVSPASLASTAAAKVDVSGEVVSPGVYTLSSASRVEDALKAAGGVTESADPNYLSKSLNLAQKISDGMKIYIPKASEALQLSSGQAGSSGIVAGISHATSGVDSDIASVININAASLSDLEKLPKVGPVTAQKIIDKRPYSSIEELYTKKAVNKFAYEEIKEMVSVY